MNKAIPVQVLVCIWILCASCGFAFDPQNQHRLPTLIEEADKGDPKAQYELGEIYYFGRGVKADPAKAFELYQKAAIQEFPDAQYALGQCYKSGNGTKQNTEEGERWIKIGVESFLKKAEEGDAYYQMRYGSIRRLWGFGAERNTEDAKKWLKKSAEQNNAQAQFLLAEMLGKSVEATSWYRKSAEQGYTSAQYRMGIICEQGNYVEQNYHEAAKWYRLAADQGNDDACWKLDELCKKGLIDKSEAGPQKEYFKRFIKKFQYLSDHGDLEGKAILQEVMDGLKKRAENGDTFFREVLQELDVK